MGMRSSWPGLFEGSHGMPLRIKRWLDIAVALTALVALSPLLAVVAIAIRLTMGRPVLFRQVRPGYQAKPFVLVKFRSMRDVKGPDGRPLAGAERQRLHAADLVTPLGWFLRRTSLDELPELWNVLKGDLSLVGPRPLLVEYLPFYTERERLRHTVRPGITGLAQVNGRNLLAWDERLEMDAQYVERWTLWLDLRIVFQTIAQVLRASGVQRDPMDEGNLDEVRQGWAAPPRPDTAPRRGYAEKWPEHGSPNPVSKAPCPQGAADHTPLVKR